jgi:tetratricopeptide (TPR) repeat protein
MSEREKYRTYGLYYMSVTKNYDKAVENFETLVKRYPSDNAALTNLALAYLGVGSVQKAADAGRHALEIYPKNLISRTNYATYSMYAGDFDTAVAQAEMVLKERPAYEWANLTLALSKASQGKEDEARAVYGRLRGFSDLGYALAGMGEADLDMYYGRSRHALAVLQDSIARDEAKKNETNLSLKLVAAAEAHLALGDAAKAYQEVERATKTSADESVLVPGAHLLVRLGKTARAEEIAASLGKLLPAHLRAYARIISADVKLSKGNTPEALDDLRAAQQLHDSWYVHWMLGNAYEAASQFTEAASEREICIKRRGEATDMFFADTSTLRSLPPVYYRLGKAQDAVGSADAARGNYQLFLKTREHADPVDVSASDAADRLKALASGAPSAPAK